MTTSNFAVTLLLFALASPAALADRDDRLNQLGCPCAAGVSCFDQYCAGTARYAAFLRSLPPAQAAEAAWLTEHKAKLTAGGSVRSVLATWGINACGDDRGDRDDRNDRNSCSAASSVRSLGDEFDACFGELRSAAAKVAALTVELAQCKANGGGSGAPMLVFTGGSPDFGDIVDGTTTVRALALANQGSEALLFDSFTFGAGQPFTAVDPVAAKGGPCLPGGVLLPGAQCSLHAAFSPRAAGSYSSTVVIGSSGCKASLADCAAGPHSQLSLTLTGSGHAPACGPGFQLLTASGAFSVPAGCSGNVRALVIGGGGAGGVYPGSGGGAGFVSSGSFALAGSVQVTVGGPGAPSSFGGLLSAQPGGNGAGGDGAPGGIGGSGGGGKYSGYFGGRGGVNGGAGGERSNEIGNGTVGQGPFPLALFTRSSVVAGGTPSNNFEGGGGGGGVVINGSAVKGGDSQNTGYGGFGYGAGGGGGNGSVGAPGAVYVEWDD